MATAIKGRRTWGMTRDSEGHREYKITWLIVSNSVNDGPAMVLTTPGLPTVGSVWNFGNDLDFWAWCRPDADVKIHEEQEGDPNFYWSLTQTFSSKPIELNNQSSQATGCSGLQIEDPLLEPARLSGSFLRYTKEADTDRNGNPIEYSSHEQIRGPLVEFDAAREIIRIEQNVAILEHLLLSAVINTVNRDPLWDLPARWIKCGAVGWERKYYGQCFVYYTRTFEFELNDESWDRMIQDKSNYAIRGRWDDDGAYVLTRVNGALPDATKTADFERYRDRAGNFAEAVLDGQGRPANVALKEETGGTGAPEDAGNSGDPATLTIEYYNESDFLLLGIPAVLA